MSKTALNQVRGHSMVVPVPHPGPECDKENTHTPLICISTVHDTEFTTDLDSPPFRMTPWPLEHYSQHVWFWCHLCLALTLPLRVIAVFSLQSLYSSVFEIFFVIFFLIGVSAQIFSWFWTLTLNFPFWIRYLPLDWFAGGGPNLFLSAKMNPFVPFTQRQSNYK